MEVARRHDIPLGSTPTKKAFFRAMSRMPTLLAQGYDNPPGPCRVIIHGKVYEVTDFLSSHPGGDQVILVREKEEEEEEANLITCGLSLTSCMTGCRIMLEISMLQGCLIYLITRPPPRSK